MRTSREGVGSSGRSHIDDLVEWQLIVRVFDQVPIIVTGGVALLLIALVGWHETGRTGFMVLGVATVVTLAGRLALEQAFSRRRSGDERIAPWRRWFIAGAWSMGALWGGSTLIVPFSLAPHLQLLIVCADLVLGIAGAARNAACPMAAKGQVLLGAAPLLALSTPAGGEGNLISCAFIALYVVAAFLLADDLHRSMVRLLSLNEQNRVLVAQVQHAAAELKAANVRLAEAATTDALTGIANRRRFDAALTDETARAQREEREVSLLLFDIDLFKGYNDVFGHQAGDVCLLRVAQALNGSLRRPADLVARYGGEEFAAILPHTSVAAAAALAERVCAAIAALAIANPGSPRGIVTVSVGVASVGPGAYRPPADFLAAADAALYAAKAAGRNCVRVAPSSSGAIVRQGALR